MKRSISYALLVTAITACGSAATSDDGSSQVQAQAFDTSSAAPGSQLESVERGVLAFALNFGMPAGNGRACATCHVPEDQFMLKPESVERRYQLYLQAKARGVPQRFLDPLFLPIDANDFAEDFTNLRQGLVRVTLPIPPNITVDELPGATTISVWRKVPTIRDVSFTAPYQLDGRILTLQEQARQAARNHAEAVADPSAQVLDDIAAFELLQFQSPRAAAVGYALANGLTPPDPFPTGLTDQEQRGQAVYTRACNACHAAPTLDAFTPVAGRKFNNITTTVAGVTPNPHNLPSYTFRCKNPDGTTTVRVGRPDPGRGMSTGVCAELSRFETMSLFGISKRAPYYHDNETNTLEGVIDVYNAGVFSFPFGTGPGTQPFSAPLNDQDKADIVAFLKRL